MDKKLKNKEVVTGELIGLDPKDELLEAAPESARWDPVPGSAGTQAPESAYEDEDDEGRGETEQLFDEGAEKAARDQMQQAALPENSSIPEAGTRKRMRERAVAIAGDNGRSPLDTTKSDWEQAKEELTKAVDGAEKTSDSKGRNSTP